YQWRLLHHSAITFRADGGFPLAGAFTPDGTLITLHEDGQLRHWDRRSRRAARTVNVGAQREVFIPTLSPDGRTLAVMTSRGPIELLDTATGRVKRVLTGHAPGAAWHRWAPDTITWFPSLAFSADSRQLASLGVFDCTIRRWDVATGQQTQCITH